MKILSNTLPRIHILRHTKDGKVFKTVSLIAPSGSANRAVGGMDLYKKMKAENPDFNVIDFRVMQYKPFF